MIEAMWSVLLELAPWLLIGVAVAGVLHVALPADFMQRHLAGRWGVLKAAALGVPLPLCSCSVIPVGLSLRQKGASRGASLAFLISTPQTGVDSILVSAGLLGWPFALFKMASAFVIGLVGGAAANAIDAPGATAKASLPLCEPVDQRGRLRAMVAYSLMLLQTIWRWLALGIVVSAAITYFIPADSLAAVGAVGNLWAMLLALAIGLPLYVCAIASVPIAAALVHGGLPASAALVFLIAGPASNVATMGAVYRSLGRRTFFVYLATIACGSLLAGWAFQSVLDGGLHASAHPHGEHHAATPAAIGSAVALALLLGWFAVEDLRHWLQGRANRREARRDDTGVALLAGATEPSIEMGVHGMSCHSCVSRLERALSQEEGVAEVAVTLHPGRAVVRGSVSAERVRELIASAGFEPR